MTGRESSNESGSAAPSATTLLAVGLVTFAMLVSETLQAITLSLQVFSHNAFLVVSIAMLGLGAGGTLASVMGRRGAAGRAPAVLYWAALSFGVGLGATGMLASRTQSIEALILLGLVPYVPAGLLLAVLFARWPHSVGRSYSADLLGSAAGCVGLVVLLQLTGSAGRVVLLASAAALGAAALLGFPLSRRHGLGASALALGAIALLPLEGALFAYRPSESKHYGRMLADRSVDSTREWSRWGYLGRLDVVRPGRGLERLDFAAWAQAVIDRGDDVRFLFASGDNWSYALRFRTPEHAVDFVREAVVSAPYVAVGGRPRVLVIGMGGGVDVFAAIAHDALSVTAVDVNPTMMSAARGLGPAWWNGALFDPRVSFVEMDGRTFTDTTRARFDVITLTAVDTGAAVAHGAFVLSENYLYTAEAFDRYLSVLEPGGVVFVMRPEPDLAKLAVTAAGALRRRGEEAVERHFVALGGEEWRGLLVFRDPLPAGAAARVQDAVRAGMARGVVTYLPDASGLPSRLASVIEVMKAGGPELAVRLDPGLRPTTDDWPFFYHRARALNGSPAGLVLGRVLGIVSVAGVLLILAPLAAWARPSQGAAAPGASLRRLAVVAYFGAIGLGFMFVEMALIQKLALLLGHPVYSLTVTLCVLLLATGVGSYLTGVVSRRAPRSLRLAPLAVAAVVALLAASLPWLMRLAVTPSGAARVACVTLVLAPLGVLLGVSFPLGMGRLAGADQALVPWAWAVNAVASVVGAALAVALALSAGFTLVLSLGGAAYVVAHLSLGALPPGRTDARQG